MSNLKIKYRRAAHITLIILGCVQLAGYIFNSTSLRGLGISYCVSPLPTVFSTIGGVEGFSTKQTLHFRGDTGKADSLRLDQHVFSQFTGHFFLKNAYAIFLAYPHIFKQQLVADVADFALCKRNIFSRFKVRTAVKNPFLQIEQNRFNKPKTIILIPKCND